MPVMLAGSTGEPGVVPARRRGRGRARTIRAARRHGAEARDDRQTAEGSSCHQSASLFHTYRTRVTGPAACRVLVARCGVGVMRRPPMRRTLRSETVAFLVPRFSAEPNDRVVAAVGGWSDGGLRPAPRARSLQLNKPSISGRCWSAGVVEQSLRPRARRGAAGRGAWEDRTKTSCRRALPGRRHSRRGTRGCAEDGREVSLGHGCSIRSQRAELGDGGRGASRSRAASRRAPRSRRARRRSRRTSARRERDDERAAARLLLQEPLGAQELEGLADGPTGDLSCSAIRASTRCSPWRTRRKGSPRGSGRRRPPRGTEAPRGAADGPTRSVRSYGAHPRTSVDSSQRPRPTTVDGRPPLP